MKKENWIWMPHPGHFIGSSNCRFFLNTYVNGFIVSTVGEYFPDSRVREIIALSKRVKIKGMGDEWDANYLDKIGYEELGYNRKYETMVFKAGKSKHKCCPYEVSSYEEIDMEGYNDPGDAADGHMKMCEKYEGMTAEWKLEKGTQDE